VTSKEVQYGRPYDLLPLIVHGPDQRSWVGSQVGGVKSWGLIGATVPRGAAGTTQLLCTNSVEGRPGSLLDSSSSG
jgi:hypothetical protein